MRRPREPADSDQTGEGPGGREYRDHRARDVRPRPTGDPRRVDLCERLPEPPSMIRRRVIAVNASGCTRSAAARFAEAAGRFKSQDCGHLRRDHTMDGKSILGVMSVARGRDGDRDLADGSDEQDAIPQLCALGAGQHMTTHWTVAPPGSPSARGGWRDARQVRYWLATSGRGPRAPAVARARSHAGGIEEPLARPARRSGPGGDLRGAALLMLDDR